MTIPLKYNLHSLRVRWRSTLATMLGIALVVAVFIMVMSLDKGMKSTYITTGDARNLIILREGATAESSSQISRNETRTIKYLEGIARNAKGEIMASAEIIVLITLERIDGEGRVIMTEDVDNSGKKYLHPQTANVLVRGVGPIALELRPRLKIVEGRMLQPGLHECIVSRRIAQRFGNCRVGQSFVSGKTMWNVVGMFDAEKTAYESEIWVDADEARSSFKRDFYGSILLRPVDENISTLLVERGQLQDQEKQHERGAGLLERLSRMLGLGGYSSEQAKARLGELDRLISPTIVGRIESENELNVKVLSEVGYFAEQTKSAGLFQWLARFLAVIMSIGAAFAAMNTMYAAVGARTREIGTLRVLGFRRRHIYASFLIESVIMSLLGGIIGCLLALPLNGLATGTFSPATFAEVAFEFRITWGLLVGGMTFSLVMGVLGGLLPARMAARKPVLDALRSV